LYFDATKLTIPAMYGCDMLMIPQGLRSHFELRFYPDLPISELYLTNDAVLTLRRNSLRTSQQLKTVHVSSNFNGGLEVQLDSRCLTPMMLRNNRLSSELHQSALVLMRDAALKNRAQIVYSAIEIANGLFANIDEHNKEFASREYARAIESLEIEAIHLDNVLQGTVSPNFQNTWVSPLKTLQIFQPEFHFNPTYPNALTISAKAGELELVRLLLMDPRVHPDNNSLHAACAKGHTEIVRLLLQRVKAHRRNLNVACQNGHTEIVRMLLVHINPTAENLMGACEDGFADIVRLLHVVANRNHLELACARGNTEIVNILLTHVTPTNLALYLACKHGHATIVSKLLPFINPNIEILPEGALKIACVNGHVNVVKILLPHVSMPFLPKGLCRFADIKLIQLLLNSFTHEDLQDAILGLNYDVVKLLRSHVKIDTHELIRFANQRILLSSDPHGLWNFFQNPEENLKNEKLRILLMVEQSLITPFDVLKTIVESACNHNIVHWIHTVVVNPQVAFAYLEFAIKRCQSNHNFKTVVDAILTHIPQQLTSLDGVRNLLLALSLCPTNEGFLSIVPFARKEDVIEIAAMSPRASSLLYALLDFPDLEPATAIRFACQFGHIDILRRVLASPHKDRLGADVIDLARQYGHPEIEYLLQQRFAN